MAKMTFKAMYLVSEDYFKEMKTKGQLESASTTVSPVQTEPSLPQAPQAPQPPQPSQTVSPPSAPPPPIPQSQTKSTSQDEEMVEGKDILADDDLESWTPPMSEPSTLIDSINDDEDKTSASTSNNKNEGDVDRTSINSSKNKKYEVVNKSTNIPKSQLIRDKEQKKSICTICNAEFNTKKKLAEHIKTRHKGKKAFVCRICKKTFESDSSLNRHIKQMHFSSQVWKSKKRVNPMAMTLAQKRKRMQNDIRDDERKPETVVKKVKEDVKSQDSENLIKCKECNKIFESFKEFKQHQLTVHSGQRKRRNIEDQWFDQNGRKIQPKRVNLM